MTAKDSIKHYRLVLATDCNQNCVFCLAKDDPCVNLSFTEAVILLKKQRTKGSELLSIDGGEPTTVPYFSDLIDECFEIGFKKIAIKTNGYGFADKEFARKILQGRQHLINIYVSLHGHNRELHESLNRVKGSFGLATRALKNIVDLNTRVVTNIVVCSKNYRFLKKYIDTIVRLGVKEAIFLFIVPEANAWRRPSLIPALPRIVPYIQEAIDYANHKGVDPALTFFPFCAIDPYYITYAAEAYMPERFKDPEDFAVGRYRPKQCFNCAYYKLCPGVWEKYYKLRGFRFKPFSKQP